ncbi:MAG: glycosyltransferase family 2 protein [Opitutales bacterium]|nr:glycosyltransferase family 2 protein [Opitutales bacterium]
MPKLSESSVPDLSLIVPMYNEEAGVSSFFDEVFKTFENSELDIEIVAVNDGSSDRTMERLRERAQQDTRIRVVDLSRNFGKDTALCAGIDFARGRAVIPLDADLQDPPEVIHQMVAEWRKGFDVVYARRVDRSSDGITKKMTAGGFYRFFNRVAQISIPANTGDFRLMDRRVVEAIKRFPERNRFMKGLFAWVGFKQAEVTYTRPARETGTTKWNYWKLWNFAIDGITSFSTLPLRIWTYVGGLTALFSICYAVYLILRTLAFGRDVPGFASIMVAVLVLGGLQLMALGIIGEYLGRTYIESKRRPLYLVQEIVNGSEAKSSPSDEL